MNYKSKLREKLSGMLFLQLKEEALKDIFKIDIEKYKELKEVFVPVDTTYLANNINDENKINNIPITTFIEGMFFAMGADINFKYNGIYIDILNNIPSSKDFVKNKIAQSVKENNLEKAFILINGLLIIDKSDDIFEKALTICEAIRENNDKFAEIEEEIIEEFINYSNVASPYLYKAIIFRDREEYELSLINLDRYLNKGGEKTGKILNFRNWLENAVNYEKGKNLVYESPKEAIKLLSSLVDEFSDNPLLYYHLAVAYRVLGLHEKAIFYLNDALRIDSAFAEPLNELGLNYASLGYYERAIEYFKKVFEVTKSLEICTNIAMCYIKLGNKKDAKLHLDIAEKIDPNDEIISEIKEMMKK